MLISSPPRTPAARSYTLIELIMVMAVLARGVSEMRVEPIGSAQDEWVAWGKWGGLQRLRLSLTWASDSADGADEASVLVNTVMFSSGDGE